MPDGSVVIGFQVGINTVFAPNERICRTQDGSTLDEGIGKSMVGKSAIFHGDVQEGKMGARHDPRSGVISSQGLIRLTLIRKTVSEPNPGRTKARIHPPRRLS